MMTYALDVEKRGIAVILLEKQVVLPGGSLATAVVQGIIFLAFVKENQTQLWLSLPMHKTILNLKITLIYCVCR